MKKLFQEFKAFINKGNALSLAIGVIIGASFTAIVTAVNKQVISPLIGALLGNSDLSESLITILSQELDPETGEMVITNAIYWGALIQACIDFLLTAAILFAIFKITTAFANAAKKAHEKARLALEELKKDNEVEEEKVEEITPVEPPKPAEPTIEEKQLALLQSINDNLLKLNTKEEK